MIDATEAIRVIRILMQTKTDTPVQCRDLLDEIVNVAEQAGFAERPVDDENE